MIAVTEALLKEAETAFHFLLVGAVTEMEVAINRENAHRRLENLEHLKARLLDVVAKEMDVAIGAERKRLQRLSPRQKKR